MDFIWFILIGALSGFIAGKIMKGGGFGILINLLLGIAGGVLGGWLFSLFGLGSKGLIGSLVISVIGAVVILWIASFFRRKS